MLSFSRSFSRTLLLNMSILVALAIGLLGTLWIYKEYVNFNRQAEAMRAVQLKSRKGELELQVKNIVDCIRIRRTQTEERLKSDISTRVIEAHALASYIYTSSNNKKDIKAVESTVRDALRALRFHNGKGYYFAVSLNGIDQLYPDNRIFEGVNVLDIRNGEGRYVFRDMIALVEKQNEGFYNYTWSKPGAQGGNFKKVSFVKYFKPLNWLIGSGIYLDELEDEVRHEMLQHIEEMSADHHGDIFVGQWDGLALAGFGKGQNLLDAGNPDLARVTREMIDLAKQEGGYLYYVMPDFNGHRKALKTSYVMGIKDWQWYVGAGDYLDDIEKSLAEDREAMLARLWENIAVILFLLIALLVISFLIARRISSKTKNNFSVLSSFFHKAAVESRQIDSATLDFVEFQRLAESANHMVAERNRVMCELRENEKRYRSLFDSASDAIIISRDNICIDCNRQALEMFGCGREELIGLSPDRFSPPLQPDGRDSHDKRLEKNRLALEGKPQFFEWTHQKHDGSPFEAEVSLSVIESSDTTYVQTIIRDITERKLAAKQLARQASAIEQAAEEIIITDSDGIVEYANPAFEQISGFSRQEAMGKAFSFLESRKQDQAYREMWASIRAGHVWRGRLSTPKKDGSVSDADATVSPIFDPAGMLMGYVFVKRDVTEQIKIEAMFRQSQKMEAIGTLAGGIAHDFNNILSAVFGFAEIAKLEIPETAGAHRCLVKILEAAGRARDLVKQILTFSRQTDMTPRSIQPKIIIKETIKLLKASLPSTIEVRSNLPANESTMADPTSIHQIIMNLCTNAGHAMRETGGILDISLLSVELDHDFARVHPEVKPGQFLRLTVSDTGHGMSHEVKERIFDPFFTTKGEGVGTGMGLSVVHGIVRSLGGTIVVHSELEKGSSFNVYLPVHARQENRHGERERTLAGGKEHILFVDDEEFIVDIAHQMLEMLGYRVVCKTDSREAFAYFKEHSGEIDLLITDFTMPRMTGMDLAKKVREIRPDLPILLCTGYNIGFSEAELKEAGINAFILKPVVRRELAEVVRKVLDGR